MIISIKANPSCFKLCNLCAVRFFKFVSMTRLFMIVSSLFLLVSCEKDPVLPVEDTLVFGHFYGMCAGESCVLTYKLTSTTLHQDTIHNYSGTDLSFVQLGDDQFEIASGLLSSFPTELLDETDQVLGCPDCYDQGGLFIEYTGGLGQGSWRLDQTQSDVPSYLHPFMDEVNETIALLN